MKVIIGPTPCATCGTPVTVVRRDVEQLCPVSPCPSCRDKRCTGGWCVPHTYGDEYDRCNCHTHTIRDVGPFTTVDEDGTRHECESNG